MATYPTLVATDVAPDDRWNYEVTLDHTVLFDDLPDAWDITSFRLPSADTDDARKRFWHLFTYTDDTPATSATPQIRFTPQRTTHDADAPTDADTRWAIRLECDFDGTPIGTKEPETTWDTFSEAVDHLQSLMHRVGADEASLSPAFTT